jgi:hypothetical protein
VTAESAAKDKIFEILTIQKFMKQTEHECPSSERRQKREKCDRELKSDFKGKWESDDLQLRCLSEKARIFK